LAYWRSRCSLSSAAKSLAALSSLLSRLDLLELIIADLFLTEISGVGMRCCEFDIFSRYCTFRLLYNLDLDSICLFAIVISTFVQCR
jgi:hypothetical protein